MHENVSSCSRGMPEFHVPPARVNWNSPGWYSHRQPFLRAPSCVFRRTSSAGRLTYIAGTPTLAHQAMSFFPYCTLTEISQEIRSKNISPVEIVELHLKRIETLQPKLNAFEMEFDDFDGRDILGSN